MQIRGTFTDFFFETALPALSSVISNRYSQYPDINPSLFDVRSSDRSIEQSTQISGVGLLTQIEEAEDVPTDSIAQGFDKTFRHSKFGLAVPTTLEMIEDDRWRLVSKAHEALARSCKETYEIDGASTFNNAFDANYLGPDGKCLCASDHPLFKSGGTQSNVAAVSADLSYTSLQLGLTDFETMRDPAGLLVRVRVKNLMVAPAFRFTAQELLKSTDRPDTASRATNTLKYAQDGVPDLIVNPYLTDSDAWFLTAAPKETGLVWYWRKRPYIKPWVVDGKEVAYTAIRYRKSHGWEDYMGVWGNPGA